VIFAVLDIVTLVVCDCILGPTTLYKYILLLLLSLLLPRNDLFLILCKLIEVIYLFALVVLLVY